MRDSAKLEVLSPQERYTFMCARLVEQIGQLRLPEGLGSAEETWEIVASPTMAFERALKVWVADRNDRSEAELRRTRHAVIQAWLSTQNAYARAQRVAS